MMNNYKTVNLEKEMPFLKKFIGLMRDQVLNFDLEIWPLSGRFVGV